MAVHLVDQSPAVCGHPDDEPCTGIERRQVVLDSDAPHTDLLDAGDELDGRGLAIEVPPSNDVDDESATLALTTYRGVTLRRA